MPAREHDARQSVAEKFCTTVQVIFQNKLYCLKAVFVWQTLPQQDVKIRRGAFSTERRQLVNNIIDVACNGKTPPDITIEITGKLENSGTIIRQKSYYEMQTRKKQTAFSKDGFYNVKIFRKLLTELKNKTTM